jgi:hypothetical protein
MSSPPGRATEFISTTRPTAPRSPSSGRPIGRRGQGARHPRYRRPVRQGCRRQGASLRLQRFEPMRKRTCASAPPSSSPWTRWPWRRPIPRSATRRCSSWAIRKSPATFPSSRPVWPRKPNPPCGAALDEGHRLAATGRSRSQSGNCRRPTLAQLKSIGSVDNIKRLDEKPGCPGDVAKACQSAVNVIEGTFPS